MKSEVKSQGIKQENVWKRKGEKAKSIIRKKKKKKRNKKEEQLKEQN